MCLISYVLHFIQKVYFRVTFIRLWDFILIHCLKVKPLCNWACYSNICFIFHISDSDITVAGNYSQTNWHKRRTCHKWFFSTLSLLQVSRRDSQYCICVLFIGVYNECVSPSLKAPPPLLKFRALSFVNRWPVPLNSCFPYWH